MTDLDLIEPDRLDRALVDHEDAYRPFHARPTSDAEWTERILAEIANPSLLGATPDTDPMAGSLARLRAVDPPIRSLGDEMVLLAAGPFVGRALPIAIRAIGSGTAAIRGLTAEAEQALAAYGRSMMNRYGRMPTTDEVLAYLKLGRHVIEGINHVIQHASTPPQLAEKDQQPDWSSPNARWDVDASGQGAMRPGYGDVPSAHPSAQDTLDLDRLFQQIITEAQQRTGELNDRFRRQGGRTFQTYVKDQISIPKRYVGRTSGFDSADRNVFLRDQRKYPSADFYHAILDRTSDRYSSIRGREQMVLDWLRAQGTAANTDSAISPLNPLRGYYLQQAEQEFGLLPPPEHKR